MLRFDPRHKDLGPTPSFDLFRVRTLQEQLHSLAKVGGGLFDGRALTGHVQLRHSAA